MACRDRDSKVRTPQVLEFCSDQPRTMQEIMDQFGHDTRFRYAVFNCVAHGKMRNLNAGNGRAKPGLYLATKSIAKKAEPAARVAASACLDWAAGKALAQVWGARA